MNDVPAIDSGGGYVRLRLDIAYDGTDFAGWAVQAGQRTVAGVLGDALTTVLRTPVQLRAAGRTDAGVHASGQVVHLDALRLAGKPSSSRIEVDEPRLSHVAAAVDTAATAVATAGVTDLAWKVGAAMPGSGATSAAAIAATAVGDAVTALARDLAEHADAVRGAALRYGDTERALAAAVSR